MTPMFSHTRRSIIKVGVYTSVFLPVSCGQQALISMTMTMVLAGQYGCYFVIKLLTSLPVLTLSLNVMPTIFYNNILNFGPNG